MEAVEVLKAAKVLLSDPKRWTRGALSKNARGQKSWATAPDAVCWCMMGAVMRVVDAKVDDLSYGVTAQAMTALRYVCHRGIPQFNDDPSTTHEMVLHKFDLAIAEATYMEKSC